MDHIHPAPLPSVHWLGSVVGKPEQSESRWQGRLGVFSCGSLPAGPCFRSGRCLHPRPHPWLGGPFFCCSTHWVLVALLQDWLVVASLLFLALSLFASPSLLVSLKPTNTIVNTLSVKLLLRLPSYLDLPNTGHNQIEV